MDGVRSSLPNCLTVLRLILASASIALYLCLQNTTAALVVFLVCCFTDFLDGYLARKWRVESDFGKTFDPIADKVLILGMLIAFLYKRTIIGWVAAILITRDVLMDAIRLMLYGKKYVIPAIATAKIKTVLQMIGIVVLMWWNANSGTLDFFIANSTAYLYHLPLIVATVFSLVSFAAYIQSIRNSAN